ncbi:MAG: translation initiation factor IF-2 [Verrucomicrobia bacterium]|nr:translation initiation factor IF-2 [Verrucomicrobiota bacterium]
MSVRIYEISKKLGLENKEILARAKAMGVTAAKVASSSLDNITAEWFEQELIKADPALAAKLAPKPVEEKPKPAPAEQPQIKVIHAPEPPPAPPAPEPAPVVEEVKAEPEPEAAPAPVAEPAAPPMPTPPAGPRVGEKIGFIQLPSRPVPRVGDKVGSVKLPPSRGGAPAGRGEPSRFQNDRDRRSPAAPQKPATTAKPTEQKPVLPAGAQVISLKSPIGIRELAEQLKQKPFKLIADLMGMGKFVTVNQSIEEIDAAKVCAKYGFKFELEKRAKGEGVVHKPVVKVEADIEDKPEQLKPRPPVVTIMGHVDHGKTSLLDVIRQADVAAGEAGGITQHIGAYTISFPHPERKKEIQQITFLDTPGHEAFSAMRARGANVTDIVILVVAANDGVMPQTVEALNHAKAAHATIIVAVNKIDHPNANALKVRQQLQEKGLTPDDWGGENIFVECSALTKQGVDKLLEMILLQADMLVLKANPDRKAKGNVIESGLEPGGPTATVLVRKGTLKVGDIVICDKHYGKVRALINEEGKRLKEAAPSVAVRLLGLNGVPEAGLEFAVVENEKAARELAEEREQAARAAGQQEARAKVTLENLFATLDSSADKVLKLVVKADTQGSVEAIVEALKKLPTDKVSCEVVHSAVGTITESDVALAAASSAVILGFHTRIDSGVNDRAKRDGVQIKLYAIIYELIDQVKESMAGLLDPILKEVVVGVAEVRKIFELSKGVPVGGCMITSGRIAKGKVRVRRRKELVYEGIAQSLRRFQDEVNEVRAGMECGIRVEGFSDLEVGDTIESYAIEKTVQKL